MKIQYSARPLSFWPYMGRQQVSSHSSPCSVSVSAASFLPSFNTSHIWTCQTPSALFPANIFLATESHFILIPTVLKLIISNYNNQLKRGGKRKKSCKRMRGKVKASAYVLFVYALCLYFQTVHVHVFIENVPSGSLSECCSDTGNPCLLLQQKNGDYLHMQSGSEPSHVSEASSQDTMLNLEQAGEYRRDGTGKSDFIILFIIS